MQDTDLVEGDGQGKGQPGSVVSTGRVGAGGRSSRRGRAGRWTYNWLSCSLFVYTQETI